MQIYIMREGIYIKIIITQELSGRSRGGAQTQIRHDMEKKYI